MRFELIDLGASRSIPENDGLRSLAQAGAEITIIAGGDAGAIARALLGLDVWTKRAILVELGTECLAFHTGERAALKMNVLGFARFRLGRNEFSPLVELVRQRDTTASALAAASAVFEAADLAVSICGDVPGRIVDRLLRPYLNAALESVDAGLAAPSDLDQVLRLGLGYPKGPIALLEASGLAAHWQVSADLYEQTGTPEFFPACRAGVAAARNRAGLGEEPTQ